MFNHLLGDGMSEANALKMALDHLWWRAHTSTKKESQEKILQAVDVLSDLLLKVESSNNPLPWER